jgi:prevent-host-death family protein
MKKFSIMESQHNLSKVLREVEAGYDVAITRRNKVVARILPPLKDDDVVFPDFETRARQTWKGGWHGSSSDRLLDESRGDR